MRGMKSAILILAVMAGVALAIPANPSRRDVAETAAKSEPEAPAVAEEAPEPEQKPSKSNATARAEAASKNATSEPEAPRQAQEPEEEKVEFVEFELPLSDESEQKAEDASAPREDLKDEELVGAAQVVESAEEMQGDAPAPSLFEEIPEDPAKEKVQASDDAQLNDNDQPQEEAQSNAEPESAEEVQQLEEAKEAEEAIEPEEAKEAEEARVAEVKEEKEEEEEVKADNNANAMNEHHKLLDDIMEQLRKMKEMFVSK